MLTIQWQEEITSLQQSLKREIAKISGGSELNIIKHICINNLKSKLDRLDEIEKILNIDKYQIVFIGTIGQGKTTAICHLFNLISNFKVSKTINGKSKDVIETRELLSTGSGRTTICEVVLKAANKTYIEIEPYTIDEMENLIFDFCDSISSKNVPCSETQINISQEIERAIRNMIDLKKVNQSIVDGDKTKNTLVDKAKELFDEAGEDILKKTALNNANIESRTKIKIEFDNQTTEQQWIKDTFAAINSVQLKEFAIPRKISLYVSNEVLSGSNLFQFDSVVDTKGLDENPIRKDLQKYIESQDVICLFVSPFNSAPEANISKLISYHLASKSKDFHHRFVTLVLPRRNEPENVNESNGDWDIGVQRKKEEIQTTFRKLNLDFFPGNILFYDALRYYQDTIVKLNEFYTEEDVQADKNEFIDAVSGVVKRRRNILLEEVKTIKESFTKIQKGDALTETEVKAIENAIQKLKSLRELGKRIPSFVYDDFINKFINYYRDTYPAWNTKHAIHRNFGYYKPRDIDIYFDAQIVAEGINENEMLRKFTREAKDEIENILQELTAANESLKTLIPELIKEFYVLYDDFIYEVGLKIHNETLSKLSPQSEQSDFWNAFMAERGRVRPRGERYGDNVCLIFERELETETSLNKFLQSKAEYYWEKLVLKTIGFFGQE
ncbi:hypothetical protein [Aliterella atlantica]|uniref:Uncharacterized protein n=1 Tax=Aliterella atlantica CENA595 TaxID=1618023 RepID=A0A0D8ZTA2_9CYAN|nr:hypothetical protein [Aliterella atlantica]KJH70466.1 hypothetical protein UH38_17765 [Aliterella atlantica CENA595]